MQFEPSPASSWSARRVPSPRFAPLSIMAPMRDVLPRLIAAGIRAVKVEGRQRSPAYVAQVTKVMRRAVDHCLDGINTAAPPTLSDALDHLAEERTHTLGACHRRWQ